MMFCEGCWATGILSILNPAWSMTAETKYPHAIFPFPGVVAVPWKS